jgi:hypothetical protein
MTRGRASRPHPPHSCSAAVCQVAAACTTCHGPRESLSVGTRAVLEARYPDDEATGYAEGALRGLIRVTFPAAVLEGAWQ